MYKVFKPEGYYANVSIENLYTHSSIIIGRMSMEARNILERAGHKIENYYSDEVNLEVNEEVAKELSSLALKMKRPVRAKTERKPEEKVKVDADIDAFDLIFGSI